MKTAKNNQGERFREMLEARFKSQEEAAAFFLASQPTIARWCKTPLFNRHFHQKQESRLREAGLNPEYLFDPDQPMFLEVAPEQAAKEIDILEKKIKRLKMALRNPATL